MTTLMESNSVMPVTVEVQYACSQIAYLPKDEDFERWAGAVLPGADRHYQLVVRVVDEAESTELNTRYREKERPTNVLSFPAEKDLPVDPPLLGDLVICAGVVAQEAQAQGKTGAAHWAHMTIHGILHLLGYDHENEGQAVEMESQEVALLAKLGFSNPYGGN